MESGKPYIKLSVDNVNPANLNVEASFKCTTLPNLVPDVSIDPQNPRRLLLTFHGTNPFPGGTNQFLSTVILPEGNVIATSQVIWRKADFDKITVRLIDDGASRTLGLATALTAKALVNQSAAPKLWLKFISTGNYALYFKDQLQGIATPPTVNGQVATINYTPQPPGTADQINLALNSTVNIITVHDAQSGLAEQGSTSTGDADSSGGGTDLLDDIVD